MPKEIEVFFRTELNADDPDVYAVRMSVHDTMETAFAQLPLNNEPRRARGYWVFRRKKTGRLVRGTKKPISLLMGDGEIFYYRRVRS